MTSALMMRVHGPDQPLTADRVAVAPAAAGWVRVSVQASGICGADLGTVRARGGAELPVTPGHEIAGTIAELGPGTAGWQVGDRVAVGWFGGSCGHCDQCRAGDVVHCPERQIPGISYPGGWAQSVTVPADALARIPDGLEPHDAAVMGCAGVTTFNAVRHCGAPAGGRVAVFGLGGLGHLAVQFATAMGYETVAIARGPERADLAWHLGAHHYLDAADAPGQALHDLGGADAIISTAPASGPLPELIRGLRVRGRLILIGIDGQTLELPVGSLVMNAQTVTGHLTGSPLDTEQAMAFALVNGVRPMTERLPLEQARTGLDRVRAGQARFRIVLEPAPAEENH